MFIRGRPPGTDFGKSTGACFPKECKLPSLFRTFTCLQLIWKRALFSWASFPTKNVIFEKDTHTDTDVSWGLAVGHSTISTLP